MNNGAVIQEQIFSGHESFPIRFTWLTRAVRQCTKPDDRDLFAKDDAMVRLAVGKNMVRSIRFWAVSTGMLDADVPSGRTARFKPSHLGDSIFGADGFDPFMEDPATVWLMHWQLASNRKLGTWYWLFNELRESEFERKAVIRELLKSIERRGGKAISENTIARDIDCLIRTYVPSDPDKRLSREELLDCPLTELGLLRRSGEGEAFSFHRDTRASLPASVFAFAVMSFWNSVAKNSNTLRFDQIAFAAGSPGQIFKLSENAVVDRLHEFGNLTQGRVRFDQTAGLRQLLRDGEIDPMRMLGKQYVRKERRAHASR